MFLTLYTTPPTTNELERMHWAVKKRLRTSLGLELRIAQLQWSPATSAEIMEPTAPGCPPTKRRRVRFTVYWRTRRVDPDNLAGGLKPVLDAMRDVGLIKNDSPRWLDMPAPQQYLARKTEPRIEITIEEV